MIVDCSALIYQQWSAKFHFLPWQEGLLAEIIHSQHRLRPSYLSPDIKTVNMGRRSGHTYFAQKLALQTFPLHTKIYTSNVADYAHLMFNTSDCHHPVELFYRTKFKGYRGGFVEVVIIDLNGEEFELFKNSFSRLKDSVPPTCTILLLESILPS